MCSSRYICHKKNPTIEDIEKGIKLLIANEVAKQLAYNVIDVVHEKVGNILKDMIQNSYDRPDYVPEMQRSEEETLKTVADILEIKLD